MKRPDASIQRNIQLKSLRSWNISLRKKQLDREIRKDSIKFFELINKELDALGFAAEPHGTFRQVRFHNLSFDDNYLQARNIYILGTIPGSPYVSISNIGFLLVRYWPHGERDGRKEVRYILDVHKLSIRQIAQIIIELLEAPHTKIREYFEAGILYTDSAYKLMMGTLYQRERETNDDCDAIEGW